ncbi:unnamed protein product [Polarella glacialis]|uniref:Acylphosphatase-like domain-containing protein n=1 Tax=Polarella glacialis TaxID=89957 RepID=A0A813DIS3_POLGL|nr:unnamed protein product [Polarella glacialis]CAE8680175.1 unnamed protein product [Polarella glacialis]|mmetsp:Transcript_5999/g.11259  ORF Transcript_5999/g.11259 Transcript_5999/m.11259 type:complete len:236 (+) Transcript_5999:176-883(+)
MVVLRKLMRLKRMLGMTKKPDISWKQEYGLLAKDKDLPYIKKGWPQFDKPYDPSNSKIPPSFKLYRAPMAPKSQVNRNSDDYSEENLHQLYGKFQFEVKGNFPNQGYTAEMEVFTTAFNLHLVGWLKIRERFMLGHVQGDTFALSYFKKWLEEKHLSTESGKMDWVRLWEFNTGIDVPLQYRHLFCDKDRRKYKNRKIHILSTLEKAQITRLERQSTERRQKEQAFLDENCVRNY